MSETSTITIETTARGLHELLDPVIPFAGKGDTLPDLGPRGDGVAHVCEFSTSPKSA